MRIPLFPLPNLVLFPSVVVPLHIFEERYKLMVNRAIERDEPFGIVLLNDPMTESEETIQRVGVTARVVEVDRLEDGRLNIVCAAEKRFRILEFTGREPYWTALVEMFADSEEPAAPLEAAASEVRRLYERAVRLSFELRGSEARELPLPDTPSDISSVLGYILEIPPAEKQRLLEMESASLRLEALATHLQKTLKELEKQILRKKAGRNGHLRNASR